MGRTAVSKTANLSSSLSPHAMRLMLGISVPTAMWRLRQMVMMSLLRRLGIDKCYRCGALIEEPTHLTLDHKLPWRGISVDRFWNLENISFSHKRCNTREDHTNNQQRGKPSPHRKTPPSESLSWCLGHKQFIAREMFSHNRSHWNGLDWYCRGCRRLQRTVRVA